MDFNDDKLNSSLTLSEQTASRLANNRRIAPNPIHLPLNC
nr:ThiJ/PfpI [uncultured bacterium]